MKVDVAVVVVDDVDGDGDVEVDPTVDVQIILVRERDRTSLTLRRGPLRIGSVDRHGRHCLVEGLPRCRRPRRGIR